MAVTITAPKHSFLQFTPDVIPSCGEDAEYHLPVVNHDDIAFQFFVNTTTKGEADALFDRANALVSVQLVKDCGGAALIDYTALMGLKPTRRRTGERQVLYWWPHGVPLFGSHVALGGCFFIRVRVAHPTAGTISACSTTLQRMAEDCLTSVLTYSAEQNVFGFNYCGSGAVDTGAIVAPEVTADCEPTIFHFTDAATIDYYYSPALKAKYGDIPKVDIYLLGENGRYTQPVIEQGFDRFPPTRILADLGGPATGFMKIS